MMNDNNKTINPKKKLIAAISSCAVALTLVALGVANTVNKSDDGPSAVPYTVTTTQNRQVDTPLENEKDNRITTIPQTADTTKQEAQSAANASATQSKAPEYYNLPLGTEISREYSADTPVYNEIMGDWRSHAGIDFACAYGDGVKAVAEGKVTAVYDDTVWGTVVEMTHGGGVTSRYCGLQSQTVGCKAGDMISAGSCIGYVGEIPCEKTDATAHLHLEMRVNGKVSDPLEVMGFTNEND